MQKLLTWFQLRPQCLVPGNSMILGYTDNKQPLTLPSTKIVSCHSFASTIFCLNYFCLPCLASTILPRLFCLDCLTSIVLLRLFCLDYFASIVLPRLFCHDRFATICIHQHPEHHPTNEVIKYINFTQQFFILKVRFIFSFQILLLDYFDYWMTIYKLQCSAFVICVRH